MDDRRLAFGSVTEPGLQAGSSPIVFWPSSASRSMSAWPACWAVSAARCMNSRPTETQLAHGRPLGRLLVIQSLHGEPQEVALSAQRLQEVSPLLVHVGGRNLRRDNGIGHGGPLAGSGRSPALPDLGQRLFVGDR